MRIDKRVIHMSGIMDLDCIARAHIMLRCDTCSATIFSAEKYSEFSFHRKAGILNMCDSCRSTLERKGELLVTAVDDDRSCLWGPRTLTTELQCPACFDMMRAGTRARWVRFSGNDVTHIVCPRCFVGDRVKIPHVRTLVFTGDLRWYENGRNHATS